ncbi:MAG: hypothetical protein IKZ96_00090 [Bacilli bacterium]|nr:hypothetical protein [Bacilli bacterium]
MGVNTEKLVEVAFSLINSLSMCEQQIERTNVFIKNVEDEIKKIQEDEKLPGMIKAMQINACRAQIEKVESSRKNLISSRDEMDSHYSEMVDVIKENGLEEELIAALTGTKIMISDEIESLSEQIELLSVSDDNKKKSDTELNLRLSKVACNVFETAIESLKGIVIEQSPSGFGGK